MPKPAALTKARIVDSALETNGYTPTKARETIKLMLELIKHSLESGDDVHITGFGKFCVKKKRRGRNPATGNDMMLPPRKVVTFKSPKKLREKINAKHLRNR
jgi:integration host factor subunit alpha